MKKSFKKVPVLNVYIYLREKIQKWNIQVFVEEKDKK